jgi:hypothetical protein
MLPWPFLLDESILQFTLATGKQGFDHQFSTCRLIVIEVIVGLFGE